MALLAHQIEVGKAVVVYLRYPPLSGKRSFIGTIMEQQGILVKVSNETGYSYPYTFTALHEISEVPEIDDNIPF